MMQKDNHMENVNDQLEETLRTNAVDQSIKVVGDISTDLTEASLDALINDGILKEIPVVKTLMVVPKVVKSITNYIFLRKIIRFLFQLEDTTPGERKEFLDGLEGSKKEEIISNLILVLDKHDHLQKAELQGKIFAAYIKKRIEYTEYMSLKYALNMMDIKTFPSLL